MLNLCICSSRNDHFCLNEKMCSGKRWKWSENIFNLKPSLQCFFLQYLVTQILNGNRLKARTIYDVRVCSTNEDDETSNPTKLPSIQTGR